ncbi:MAG: hypothetical protein QOK49_2626, partial [Baekduia sp.]|nr:hypothetical protein [Baekduia sp.]
PQEHEAVDVVQGGEQPVQRLGMAKDVATEAAAEVEIGDDERAHVSPA